MNNVPDLAKEWVRKAENDLLDADNNLNAEQTPYDMVCFHCQQGAEKTLKAFLVLKNIPFSKTHDLLTLLELTLTVEPEMNDLRNCLEFLNPFSVTIRYPTGLPSPTSEEAQEARIQVDKVYQWFKNKVPELF